MADEVPKQAVIVVHGMGEQRPMDTLKGFVRAVWEGDLAIAAPDKSNPNATWSKPDGRTGSLELRRITTRESIASKAFPKGVRTDFYELYWADLTAGSTWRQFVAWVRYLLFRPLRRVPKDVRGVWALLWAASILVVMGGLISIVPDSLWERLGSIAKWKWAIVAAAALLGAALHHVATTTFGRVVRYTRADPDNIASRAAVRERGLNLLDRLHSGDTYSRIVVVGHSLGSMLAYDLISYYWASRIAVRRTEAGSQEFAALCRVEAAAGELEKAAKTPADTQHFLAARNAYWTAQTALRRLLAARPPSGDRDNGRWLISDFVTMGSPLTHAEFLIASSETDLDDRKRARELPSAPPYRETLDDDVLAAAVATAALPIAHPAKDTVLLAFPELEHPGRWTLHHAAPFAAVRWTNIYDPASWVVMGDVIGGPLAPNLGPAIVDKDLRALRGPSRRFSHTRYWHPKSLEAQLEEVREAVNLLDR